MNRDDSPIFWHNLIIELSKIDYGVKIPELDDSFLKIWSDHYYSISKIILPNSDFLEIGTGFGVLATGIARLSGQRCFTVEHPSRSYFTSKTYIQFLSSNYVYIIGCDLTDGLPFKTGSFSLIYLCDVIEHLVFYDIKTLLDEIVRLLKPDGKLVISTPNLNRLGNIMRILCGYSPNPPLYAELCGKTFGHIREFAPNELCHILSAHGFKVQICSFGLNPSFSFEAFGAENIFSKSQSQWINRTNRMLSKVFPTLGDEIYLLATK